MTWLRILLAIILVIQNLVIPFGYVRAEEELVVHINYQTKDKKTPEAVEYVSQVNNAATNGKTYNFYTLSGVIKTVKAKEKGVEGSSYYHTGDGAPGYLVIAYDRISGRSLAYKDWVAATTTNANGKFAIPIEKTQPGVFLVVLRPVGDKFRFITSYDVSSELVGVAQHYPENGLNIGVIEYVDDQKSIQQYIDSIPDSIKVVDNEDYWDCGDESGFKYKHEGYETSAKFPVSLTDRSYEGNVIPLRGSDSIETVLNGGTSLLIPTNAEMLYRDQVEGRSDRIAATNYTGTMSSLSFFNGVLNRFQPTKDVYVIPSCTEFLKTKYINTGDYNKNYYTYNGITALLLPYTAQTKIEQGDMQEEVLRNTVACKNTDSTNKTYYDLVQEGYEGVFQNFMVEENFQETMTSRTFQDKVDNDSITNEPNDNVARDVPFYADDAENNAAGNIRGEKAAVAEATQMIPKENEIKRIFSNALTEDAPYKTFSISNLSAKDQSLFVYEIGPLKTLCEITKVKENGTKLIKNEERKESLTLSQDDKTAGGWILTNADYVAGGPTDPITQEITFYGDHLIDTVFNFVSNLITRFASFINQSRKLEVNDSCFSPQNPENPGSYRLLTKEECDQSKETYGSMACERVLIDSSTTPPTYEYREYKKFVYTCAGASDYKLNLVSKQKDEGNIDMKGNTPNKNTENIREALRIDVGVGGEVPLSVGKGTIEIFEVTGAGGPVMYVNKDIDSAATDTLDYLRFSMNIPDGTGKVELPYNEVVVKLIDRDARQAGDSNIFAGGANIGNRQKPDPLENPLPCPVGNGTCGNLIGCDSYPSCHGSSSYWSFIGGTPGSCYPIPSLTGTMAPIGDPNNPCSSKSPKGNDYGYALDVVSACGDRNIYAPSVSDISEWKVVTVRSVPQSGGTPTPSSSLQGFVDIEGIGSQGVIKFRFYHMGVIDVNSGDTIDPGAPVGAYATWMLAGGVDNSHSHIEMMVNGQAVPPEDNLQCN